jgi:hypothetical protein
MVTAVDGTSVTLDAPVPADLSNVQWSLSGSLAEGGAIRSNFSGSTIAQQAVGDARMWGSSKQTQPHRVKVIVADNSVYTGSAPANSDSFHFEPDGQCLAMRGPLGYGAQLGAGGSVTQTTSKATAVTLNTPNGLINMNNAQLAAGASVIFTLNNTWLTLFDTVVVNIRGDRGTPDSYRVEALAINAGSCRIRLTNLSSGPLSEALRLTFSISRGSVS